MKITPRAFIHFGTRLLLVVLCSKLAFAGDWKLAVSAGSHERSESIVTFAAPPGLRGGALIETGDGASVPVQIDDAGRAVFISPKLASGATKSFTLRSADKLPPGIAAAKSGDLLEFAAGGRPLFGYQMEAGAVPADVPPIFSHGAHLHPVFSPAGKLVTGNHPSDHRWHRGIWMAWTKTEFEGRHPDFWNQGKGESGDAPLEKLLAEVRFASLEKRWSGPVQAGFVSHHRFIDHSGGEAKDVLLETWEVNAYRLNVANVIDLVSTQKCAGASPLKLPKYHYGGLGIRGNQLWNPVDAVTMLTSNGDDRKKGDSTKAKWVQLGGEVDGAPAGLVVLIHPSNFRFPQPLRLNPKNPQICIAPSQDGDWSIEPGQNYVSRYRILAMDGKPDAALLDQLWQDYAEPSIATVEAAK